MLTLGFKILDEAPVRHRGGKPRDNSKPPLWPKGSMCPMVIVLIMDAMGNHSTITITHMEGPCLFRSSTSNNLEAYFSTLDFRNMKKRNDKEFTYRQTIYFDTAKMYSKRNCKMCHGRGYLKFITPEKEENCVYCDCAVKNMRKYG